MKNKTLLSFIVIVFSILAFGVFDVSAETEEIYTYTVSNGEAEITGCDTSATGELVIPDTLGGYPVTSIGNSAFYYCSSLTSVIISDGVTSIGDYAFYSCSTLTEIIIPDSVTSIGKSAFYQCSKLTSVIIPDSVTSIGESAFSQCSKLTSVIIPDSVTSISAHMFLRCLSLKSVSIPDSVTSIREYAFEDCNYLSSITIPGSVISIGDYAFSGCSSLTEITIPDSVTSIGESAFSQCGKLTSVIIPDSMTSISHYMFFECPSLKSVSIPDSVTSIGAYAFYKCYSLASIKIPDRVTSIGVCAFGSCNSLSSIIMPRSLTCIREYAFDGCLNIKLVFYKGNETDWDGISFYYMNENLTNAEIIYNAEERTFRFETNCEATLPDITDVAVFYSPTVQNEGKTFIGWYNNEALNGKPVSFPYYGDATTLYASWTDGTGISFEDAIVVKANQDYTVTTTEAGQLLYFEFVADKTKTYRIYSKGSINTCGYLYDENKNQLAYNDDTEDGTNFAISYNLNAGEKYYIAAKCYSGTGTFTVFIEEPFDYRINGITLKDMSGSILSEIPSSEFLATISFTNVSSSAETTIVLAKYTDSGIFKGLMFINTEDMPTGSTMKLTLPVDNQNGDIAKLKAFLLASFDSLVPLGNSVSFPAE